MKILLNFFWLFAIIGLSITIFNWQIRILDLEFWHIFSLMIGGGLGVISAFIFFLCQVVLEKKIKSKYILFLINMILVSIILFVVFFIFQAS